MRERRDRLGFALEARRAPIRPRRAWRQDLDRHLAIEPGVGRARYTSPIPPAPSGATISYCPSLVPITVRLHGRRVDRDRCPAVILAHGTWVRSRDVDDGGEGR